MAVAQCAHDHGCDVIGNNDFDLRPRDRARRALLHRHRGRERLAASVAACGDDLDADSLDLVELVMALEEEFDIAVPEEDLEGVETVKNAYDLVTGKL